MVAPVRVVSLVPSVTETLTAWGVGVAACTRFCERPDLAMVGGTKNPDIAAIVAIDPDVVVVDRQENRREDAAELEAAGLRLCVLDVTSVDDLGTELAQLAEAVGVPPREPPVPAFDAIGLSAFVPIWRRPWMTIGRQTYGSSLLAALGVTNCYGDSADHYPEVTLDDVEQRAPDAILVPSEPYTFTDAHLTDLTTIAPVLRVDGQDLFWWGSRTPAAMARLHAQLRDFCR